MRAFLLVVLLAFAPACASVAFTSPTPELTWRGRSLHEGEFAGVVAVDAERAASGHRDWQRFVDAMRASGLELPPKPLWIALDVDEPHLYGDARQTALLLLRFRGEDSELAVGAELDAATQGMPEAVEWLANTILAPVPLSAPELELPPQWRERYAWAVVAPTPECLDEVARRLVDKGLEREGVGALQRVLLAPFLPFARERVLSEWRTRNTVVLLGAALRDARPDPVAVAACLERLGVEGVTVRPDER